MGIDNNVKMDKLSRDACEAIKAGMSYGKYMAMKKPEMVKKPLYAGRKRVCLHCGREFTEQDERKRKYCSDRCRNAFYYYAQKDRNALAKKKCPVCGKEFMPQTHRNKYCSEFCGRVAKCQHVKDYQARKATKKEGL